LQTFADTLGSHRQLDGILTHARNSKRGPCGWGLPSAPSLREGSAFDRLQVTRSGSIAPGAKPWPTRTRHRECHGSPHL